MTFSPQLPLGLDRLPAPAFDNFWPGPNSGVVAALQAIAEADECGWIGISGAPGSGKTHLLSAVTAAAHGANRKALFLSGNRLRTEAEPRVLDAYGDCRLLCFDDLHCLLGDRHWEEALFHLLNRLRAAQASFVYAAPKPPSRLPIGLPDLASRLSWGTHLRLASLSDAEKGELLTRRAFGCGLHPEPDAIAVMLRRLPRDVPTLVRALDTLAAASLAQKRRFTARFVSDALRADLIQSHE